MMTTDIEVQLDPASGAVSIIPDQIDAGSSDECTIVDKQLSQTMFDCSHTAQSDPVNYGDGVQVILTVSDPSGNTQSDSARVRVIDSDIPSVLCQASYQAILSSRDGTVTVLASMLVSQANDVCGIKSIQARLTNNGGEPEEMLSFDCSNVGLNSVDVIVTDNNDNQNTCTLTVEVIDQTVPNAVCEPSTIFVTLDSTGYGSITYEDVDSSSSDACGIMDRHLSQSLFGCDNVMGSSSAMNPVTSVTLTVTDNNGNTASCSSSIQVRDQDPPQILCAPTVEFVLDPLTHSVNILDTDLLSSGSDACGITSYQVSRPIAYCSDIYPSLTSVDLSAQDSSGNVATCTSQVRVYDMTPPDMYCVPGPIVIYIDPYSGVANLEVPQVNAASSDGCSGMLDFHRNGQLSLSSTSFDCSQALAPQNSHTVELTGTDMSGNSATCSSQVTVVDNYPPHAMCVSPSTVTVELDHQGQGSLSTTEIDAGSNDICGIDTLSLSRTSFSCSDVAGSPQTVDLTVTDRHGNSQTCSTTVDVRDSQIPTALCRTFAVQLGGDGTATINPSDVDAGSTDNCGLVTLVSVEPSMFTTADVGNNLVTLTVEDQFGSSSTCQATVNVYDDTPPMAVCRDYVIELNGLDGTATLEPSMVDGGSSDPSGIQSMSVSPSSLTCSDARASPVTVTLTVTDNNQNQATCTAHVTVRDVTAPDVTCSASFSLELDSAGSASISYEQIVMTVSDACTPSSSLSYELDRSEFSCSDVGFSPSVTVTVSDEFGISGSCSTTIDVQDHVAPEAMCNPYTVELDYMGHGSITPSDVDASSSDACGVESYSLSRDSFTCEDAMNSPVSTVLEVTDVNGNTHDCTADIDVRDSIAPTALCSSISMIEFDLDSAGHIDLNDPIHSAIDTIDAGSFDNCGIRDRQISPTSFSCADVLTSP
ncbi:MAG: hypothetical protein KIT69_14090, partial [Propionibacteriaceae bacterium]|nr:hypothetical protein [Propionibacteriaceae bacterium]